MIFQHKHKYLNKQTYKQTQWGLEGTNGSKGLKLIESIMKLDEFDGIDQMTFKDGVYGAMSVCFVFPFVIVLNITANMCNINN